MNKLELIKKLAEEGRLSRFAATKIVEIFFEEMSEVLAKGDRVEIRGLWSFFVKEYKGYLGRNPKTGKKVPISEKRLPFFKAGKELRERVNKKKRR